MWATSFLNGSSLASGESSAGRLADKYFKYIYLHTELWPVLEQDF
jgi:hypothetical protein